MGIRLLSLAVAAMLLGYYVYLPLPETLDERWKVMVVDACFRSLEHLAELTEFIGLKHYMEVMMLLTVAEMVGPTSDINVTVVDTTFNGVAVRVFEPATRNAGLRRAVIYMHGGGWCLGSAKMLPYDALSRRSATELNAVIVSVEYRLAPQHHFPDQFNDVYAVVKYFLQRDVLAQYMVDPGRVAVAGDSAGGNLAAAVAQQIREEPGVEVEIKIQALVYPALQTIDFNTPSYQQNENMPILPKKLMVRFWSEYFSPDKSLLKAMGANAHTGLEARGLSSLVNWSVLLPEKFRKEYKYTLPARGNEGTSHAKVPGVFDPRAAPLLAEDKELRALPQALIMTCEFDVLRDDGTMYATRLQQAGVQVALEHFEDCFHGVLMFITWPTNFAIGHKLMDRYIDWLRENL
ncbi:arylacetamide deacetylase-like isoform X1 [Hypanus sabinus]|uniref:arylacetamide deacetylase-like isoform X1 n=2 Tax=Hypanus sabinus TaxID=79690 RepID=UPI0028C477B8|nr:arylacetamide deacetylase-like isoform X1 [Hypanus sabinus]